MYTMIVARGYGQLPILNLGARKVLLCCLGLNLLVLLGDQSFLRHVMILGISHSDVWIKKKIVRNGNSHYKCLFISMIFCT